MAERVRTVAVKTTLECEGACEQHEGLVRTVFVENPRTGTVWGCFNYCDRACAKDRATGFTVLDTFEAP